MRALARPSSGAETSDPQTSWFAALRRLVRWYRAPVWIFALLTGAKSFVDNPILGSRRLNAAGLHVWRLRAAHALARWRRARLANLIPEGLREQFERDGFIVVSDVLQPADFQAVQMSAFDPELDCREQQQGDTLTRRIAAGAGFRRRVPQLGALLNDPWWKGIMSYVSGTRSEPLYYIQSVAGGVADGPPDPQIELHSDTFQPSLKAWLFLTDVRSDDRPLTYVAGSHRLSRARIAWERKRSLEVLRTGDRLSQRGSLRSALEELPDLNLPSPTHFCVPANTLVVIDTCGFHARAESHRPSFRAELWAYGRRTPFVPWIRGGPLSWSPIAARRVEWIGPIVDWLDRRGWMKQHWRPVGHRRVC